MKATVINKYKRDFKKGHQLNCNAENIIKVEAKKKGKQSTNAVNEVRVIASLDLEIVYFLVS